MYANGRETALYLPQQNPNEAFLFFRILVMGSRRLTHLFWGVFLGLLFGLSGGTTPSRATTRPSSKKIITQNSTLIPTTL
jgi:hypothetical protein